MYQNEIEIFKWDGIWRARGGNFIELGYLDDEKTEETVETVFKMIK